MARIERSIEVRRPPEDVFRLLTDLDRLTEWATVAGKTVAVPEMPLRAGQKFRHTIKVAGVDIDGDWTVVELEAPRVVAYEAMSTGGAWLRMRQRVEPAEEGSRVELEVDYELPGGLLGELADRVYVERRNEREAEHSLQNLKDILEGRAPSFPS